MLSWAGKPLPRDAFGGCLEGLAATAPLDPALAQLQDLVRVRRRFVDECASLGR